MSALEASRKHGTRPSHSYTEELRWFQDPETRELVRREVAHNGTNGAASLLVVYAEDLQPPMQKWIAAIDVSAERFNAFRMRDGNEVMPNPLSGMQRLTGQTGYDPRQLRALLYGPTSYESGKPRWCGIEKAEALLIVADLEYMLGAGQIKIRRNPEMRRETWEARMLARGVDKPYEALT